MKKILFQGDSITDVGRQRDLSNPFNVMGGGYPLLLRSRLYLDHPGEYECLNRGISGNRVVDLYARIQKDMLNIAPDYLSILIGVNDVWHEIAEQNGVDVDKFEMVYCLLIEELKAALPELKIMILEPFALAADVTDPADKPERYAPFRRETELRAQAAKRVAEKYGLVFVPLQEAFDRAEANAPVRGQWLWDGVHPTAAGHEMIAREVVKAIKKDIG